MYFTRKILPALKEHLGKRQITVLTGMRRTGKTTLVKHLLDEISSKNKIYIDLERLDNREIFSEKNYDSVLSGFRQRGIDIQKKSYIALDEIQLCPDIASTMKYLYDNHAIKFIVTSSSSYYLKNLFTESLAGRKKIFELYPLDFGEFLTFKKIPYAGGRFLEKQFALHEYERLKKYYEEYIKYGGFPEVALARTKEEKKDLVSDIISSYINIDINSITDLRNQENLYKLMKLLAVRTGTRLDYMKLSRLSGISRVTLLKYMELLEKTYIIFRISVISANPDREIVKAKKLYFCDNGILNYLGEISGGTQFENAVFNQLRPCGRIDYYALKTGREIDFIMNKETALEAKETPEEADLKKLEQISRQAQIKKFRLIGRHPVPRFKNYIWGGDIR